MRIEAFDFLKDLFRKNGFRLYVVGGTVRDFLLGKEITDLDFVTDATPEDELKFIPEADFTFKKFGAVRYPYKGKHIDITTLRQEGEYNDSRHPSKVAFVKDPKLDYVRRDFTINAMYLDEEYNVIDFSTGQEDLKKKLIRFIGDPHKRIEEDPLRIARAERFAKTLGFEIEEETLKAINDKRDLLGKLNPEKLKEEQKKGWKGTL
ncbi:MAG: CCA tRNA nucleotidyltransferase [Bacilli bacterium]|nr:CCA tRNA nucleotidyltransferase [Bacilli bacterium]